MIKVSINIPTLQVNDILSNIPIVSDIVTLQSQIDGIAGEINSVKRAILGNSLGEVISGLESLTQNIDQFTIGIEKIPGMATVTPSVPGFENILTKTVSSSTDLNKITGNGVQNGSLFEIVISTAPRSVKSGMYQKLGKTPDYSVVDPIIPSEFKSNSSKAFDAVEQANAAITNIVNEVNSAVSNLKINVNTAVGSVSVNPLDSVSLKVDNYIERQIREVTNNDIPEDIVYSATRNISIDKDPTSAINKIEPFKKVTSSELEEAISSLPTSPSSQIESYSPATKDFGQSTEKIKTVRSAPSSWKGASTNLRTYTFESVSSIEELISEFRTITRPITEFVTHWTANYNDQGHVGARQMHEVAVARGFSGCSYHYVVKKDGTIERGRPVNIEGAHSLNGHNKYSIAISFVAGYNCNAGTPHPERYVSAQSITPAQMAAFDKFCKAFYSVWPGGQAYGHNDTDPRRKVDPGFDVPEYVKTKFGKFNVLAAAQGPLTPGQLALV
jgi:N-acetylmuramoyl-L-alanine amidase